MSVKYEIHTLKNAGGKGDERKYVVLRRSKPLNENEMEQRIQNSCTLTVGDVKAVLSELRAMAVEQLREGKRFCLPGIGWLSLTTVLDKKAQGKDYKVTGNDIYPKGIRFDMDGKFFDDVTRGLGFEKSKYSTKSQTYSEEDLWQKIAAYLSKKGCITCGILQREFGLSRYYANKWLALFLKEGKIRKAGTVHNIIYLAA
jgi:hypothetical protein